MSQRQILDVRSDSFVRSVRVTVREELLSEAHKLLPCEWRWDGNGGNREMNWHSAVVFDRPHGSLPPEPPVGFNVREAYGFVRWTYGTDA
jgi:hypothetical protein